MKYSLKQRLYASYTALGIYFELATTPMYIWLVFTIPLLIFFGLIHCVVAFFFPQTVAF